MHRRVETKDDIVFFKSNLPGENRLLSNFADLSEPIELDGEVYPTVEHAYQAKARLGKDERHLMQVGGDLASWKGFAKLMGNFKKPSHGLLGWIAKVAVNKTNSKKLRLKMGARRMDSEEALSYLQTLLKRKFKNAKERSALMRTGDRYILEFDSRGGEKSFWGGKAIYDEEKGARKKVAKIVGGNKLGRMLMKLRHKIGTRTNDGE